MGTPGYYEAQRVPSQQSPYLDLSQAYPADQQTQPQESLGGMQPPAQATQHVPQQNVRQFLTSLLGQSGNQSLPYEEGNKWLIREQLVQALEHYPSLTPSASAFMHNDGRTAYLLRLSGTIPVVYKGGHYNIPITLWLPEAFPLVAPLVFVTPTRNMVLRQDHRHVDRSGVVDVACLLKWTFLSSSLYELIQVLCTTFGQETPLFSRHEPPAAALGAAATAGGHSGGSPHLQSARSVEQQPVEVPNGAPLGARAAAAVSPLRGHPGGLAQGVGVYNGSVPAGDAGWSGSGLGGGEVAGAVSTLGGSVAAFKPEDPVDVFRRNAVAALTQRLQRDVGESCKEATRRIESMVGVQQFLQDRNQHVLRGMQRLEQEKAALEQALQVHVKSAESLEGWLSTNKGRVPAEIDPDKLYTFADPLSRQLLHAMASDLTIEDTMYALDKALQADSGTSSRASVVVATPGSLTTGREEPGKPDRALPVEAYLRLVRSLAREQFFFRATQIKALGAQPAVGAPRPYARPSIPAGMAGALGPAGGAAAVQSGYPHR